MNGCAGKWGTTFNDLGPKWMILTSLVASYSRPRPDVILVQVEANDVEEENISQVTKVTFSSRGNSRVEVVHRVACCFNFKDRSILVSGRYCHPEQMIRTVPVHKLRLQRI